MAHHTQTERPIKQNRNENLSSVLEAVVNEAPDFG